MFLADIFLSLRGQVTDTLNFVTKAELEDHQYLPKPLPDAYIAITEGEETKRYFLEIISDQVPRYVIRKHIEYLFKYYSSGKWEKYSKHAFPTFLMVCPNYVTRGFLSKFITQSRDYETKEANFYLTTEDQIKSQGMKNDIWQKVD